MGKEEIVKKDFNQIVEKERIISHYKGEKPLTKHMCLLLHGKRGSLNGQ